MELVNTGRRVRNPLQHKGFRRFQNCRHRPQQTRKYQVRTRLEMVEQAVSFIYLKVPCLWGFAPVQKSKYFVVLSCSSALSFWWNFGLNIHGELSEWSKVQHSKCCVPKRNLGFESLTLRQKSSKQAGLLDFSFSLQVFTEHRIFRAELLFSLFRFCISHLTPFAFEVSGIGQRHSAHHRLRRGKL